MIAKPEEEITLLREYRTSLITDLVAGRFDIHEAEMQLQDEVQEPEPLDGSAEFSDVEAEAADEFDKALQDSES